jgi:glucose/mannose-6-phosphate isomerase
MVDQQETAPSTLVDLAHKFDTNKMIGYTQSFVDDLRKGFAFVQQSNDDWYALLAEQHWNAVLCLGMGGSASSGDFLSALADHEGTVPIRVHRDYDVPSWWNDKTLVIATSHSGTTEETVLATEQILKRGGVVIVIASGGELAAFSELYSTCFLVPTVGGQPPRTAFGHIFSRQYACLQRLGLLKKKSVQEINEIFDRLAIVSQNFDFTLDPEGDIAQLAAAMTTRPISILGPTECGPAVLRFKNQLNENSARFAKIALLPEMNHNEIVAWGGVGEHGDPSSESQVLLVLSWEGMHPRVLQRMDWLIAHSPTEFAWRIRGEGQSLFESLLYHCIIMDWLSIALSLLHGKNPNTIQPIMSLKEYLNSVQ